MKRADKAEKEVEELVKKLEGLEPLVKAAQEAKNKGGQDGQEVPEELAKLRTENTKLKYRLGILQRATERVMVRLETINPC